MADLPFGDVDSRRNGWGREPAQDPAAGGPEPATERQNDHDEDRAGHDAGRLGGAGQGIAELEDDHRPEEAPPQRSDAPERRDEHPLPGGGPGKPSERGKAIPAAE